MSVRQQVNLATRDEAYHVLKVVAPHSPTPDRLGTALSLL